MRCSKCGTDNAAGSRFCNQCATPLGKRCPKCAHENISEAKFCAQCAAPLDGSPVPARAEAREELIGERRHLTVLFCDLVGSTALAARLDPEEWRAIVADYHLAVGQAVERFGGYVAHYLGDGVMAFFGYPQAHDNDAERAARAGLAILDAIAKHNSQGGTGLSLSSPVKLIARVGIDSGAVVVGAGAGKEADVFGDAPNIAARVQAAAEPGTVLITDAVHRLVSGLFVVDDLGAHSLKGIEQPTQLYRVIQPSGVRGRLEAAAAGRGLTPFVGREDELRLLANRWERALDGEGQVALIIGEAGIGKSRLVQRFHEQIKGTPHTWVDAAAAPFFQNTPFYPVAAMLRELVASGGDEPTEEQLAQLESRLTSAGVKPADAIPLLAPLLNLPLTQKHPASSLSPDQQRRRLLATLVEWVLGASRVQPLVVAIEDLQWADPSTLELTQLLVEQGARSRLLFLYTARPEFHAEWPLRAHHTQITLNRLSVRNVRDMIAQVAAHNALASETVDAVLERTSGVPLFVEELTRSVLEGGARLGGREIPVTLHDSLMARLDRMGGGKEVAQVGAVIGGEFSYELLHAVHPIAEAQLQAALLKLTDSELLYVRGIAPNATYQFKHALIRDAAYGALLKSHRKELHRQVARTIEEKFPALNLAHPEVLARHWTEAGESEEAIAGWSRVGKTAQERYAFSEAQESYQQALTLQKLLPESPERDVSELKLRISLVSILHMTRGWAVPETVVAAERAGILAEKNGGLGPLVGSMALRCLHSYAAGDLSIAGALADQALELALREANPTVLGHLYTEQVLVRHMRGDLAGAEKYFTTGLEFFDDVVFRQHPTGVAISVFGTASWNAWILGRTDVARERMAKMMAAVNRANPHDLPWSDGHAAVLHGLARENEQAETLAARALELCEKHKFPNEAAYSRAILGAARVHLGRTAEGIALIREGMAGLLGIGIRIGIIPCINSVAAAQKLDGAISDALDTIEQALQFNPAELIYRPETLTLRGELRLKQGHSELAEADFHEAIALAQKMGAKAWELRATMSLARLLEAQGRRDEARAMLAEIYGWFTEGFDTADLKDAKALLDELSA